MKSLKTLLLFVFMTTLSLNIQADDRKYLEGAVPLVDGKVVFTREFTVQGVSKDEIFNRMLNWMEKRLAQGEENSRILYSDKEKGQIAGLGYEYLVFRSSFLSLDRSLLEYYVVADCDNERCQVSIERLKFDYEEEVYPAEEWITDEYALNKKKTKLNRGLAKFRTNTVDYVQKFFDDAALALGQSTPVVAQTPAVTTAPVVQVEPKSDTQVIVQTPAVTTASSTPMIALQAETKSEMKGLNGFTAVDPHKIPGNIIKMLEMDWMLITAGNDSQFNMMTASWGGLGRLYERPTATCFIYPTRYTYQYMEKGDYYTLSFYTEAYREQLKYCGSNSGKDTDKVKATGLTPITTPNGAKAFAEAWLIIECKKMVSQTLTPEALVDEKVKEEWIGKQLHKMYIGEITNVWVK